MAAVKEYDTDRVLRIGVLGCAGIAERRMLPSLAAQPLVRVTAVASRREERARSFAQRFGGVPVFDGTDADGTDASPDPAAAPAAYQQLLERDDVDAVYIPLPPALHHEWTLRALRAGKHVLCEKPFAQTLDQARQAVAVARERGLVVMESFMFLHHSQHTSVRKLVADGRIGELRLFESEFGIPATPDATAPRGVRHASTLPEVAVYPIRAAQFFLGSRLSVLGAIRRASCDGEPDSSGAALLASADGVPAELAYGLEHGYRSGYTLWGSEGSLRLDRAFSTPDDHVPVARVERGGTVTDVPLAPDRQFTNIAGVFARTVLDAQDPAPHADDILHHAELLAELDAAAAGR
ncbi:Gfo/Idh/MocA family protein [Streptomyces sp. NPDC059037]|uniref:Gfo/Idh/MocA family protein n=1 Tax=Streptomyces sp. NPDC059037 TaxID=3346710 RepID=UPI0036BF2D69